MKKLLVGLFSLFFIVSCYELCGILTVEKDLSLITSSDKTEVLQPMLYSVKLKLDLDKSRLVMKFEKPNIKVYFNFLEGYLNENYVGEFIIRSQESNQNYDLLGEIIKAETVSQQYTEHESCILYYTPIQHCYVQNGQVYCYIEHRPVYGIREVTYHYVYKTDEVKGIFTIPRTSEVVAEFKTTDTDKDTIIDHIGRCY